jgi:hypothetical protein
MVAAQQFDGLCAESLAAAPFGDFHEVDLQSIAGFLDPVAGIQQPCDGEAEIELLGQGQGSLEMLKPHACYPPVEWAGLGGAMGGHAFEPGPMG